MRFCSLLLSVLLLFCLTPAFAIRTARPSLVDTTNTSSNSTDWTSWFSYALRPLSRKQVEEGLEARWKQLEDDVSAQRSKFTQHMEHVSLQSKKRMEELDENITQEKKKLKKRIEADILKQKRGWKRFRNGVRAQAGIVVGGAMTFGALAQTAAPTVQAAQLTWGAVSKYNFTRGIHDPWLKDATAGILAVAIIAKASGESNGEESKLKQQTIPLMTIGLAIVESVAMILDQFEGNVTPTTRIAVETISALLGTAALSLIPLPISAVAASIAGASLLFQSVVAEVVSNWWVLLERGTQSFKNMDREERRKIEKGIRKQVYHVLEQKLIYPVTNVFDEISAAIHNQTLEEPSLQDKIHVAIQKSLKVKLVWSVATAGIMVQLLWKTKPVEHAACAVHSWWSDITAPKPRPIKKRRNR